MKRFNRSVHNALAAVVVASLAAATSAVAQSASQEALLAGHRGAPDTWPMYGGNYGQMRYTDLDQINRDTVKNLKPAWTFHTGVYNVASGFQTTPVVIGESMYVTTPRVGRDQWVIKLNAKNGKERWRTKIPTGATRFCCGANNRGVAVYEDKVFMASIDAQLHALDEKSGDILWKSQIGDGRESYSHTSAPIVYDGKVIVGSAGGEYGIRGFMKAFDAESGEELWIWHSIPSPDEGGWLGTWQETLPGVGLSLNRDIEAEKASVDQYPDAWKHGGGAVWTTASFDPELRLLFAITGNPGPDFDGTVRPGDNLWSDSICAINIDDGTLAWGFQYLPHDIWDSGGPPPVLFEVEWEDQATPVAGLFTKIGYFYMLDRRTGELLKVSEPYAPQQNFLAPLTEEGIVIAPGGAGGTNWSPAAYSPQTGLVYSANLHWPMLMRTDPGIPYKPGTYQGGSASFATEGVERYGFMAAIDPLSGKIAWKTRTELPLFSGVLVTAGGLVFAGQSDASFDAWDAETGEHLWQYETEAGVNAAPATYQIDGTQYVAVAAGGSRYVRRSRSDPPQADAIHAFTIGK